MVVDQKENTFQRSAYYIRLRNANKAEPTGLWNPEETSPQIQNMGTSGPKIGHMNVSIFISVDSNPHRKHRRQLWNGP